jgi:hypothetical protein
LEPYINLTTLCLGNRVILFDPEKITVCSKLTTLEIVDTEHFPLTCLTQLRQLQYLKIVDASDKVIPVLTWIQSLFLFNCNYLILEKWDNLTELTISNCDIIVLLMLNNNLITLNLLNLKYLIHITSLLQCKKLVKLNIKKCPRIDHFTLNRLNIVVENL